MTSASNSTRRRPSPASGTIEINRQMGILFCQSERGDGMFRRSNGRAYNINTCVFLKILHGSHAAASRLMI